jgi:alpha-L-rhamnosidase
MIAEGATSFWEAYDPQWPKKDFHASLEADSKKGYYISLAHGWASGPTAWLMQQILGIEPTGAGFRTVTIRPDLAGLTWVSGAEPTPHGLIGVSATPAKIIVTLPSMMTATVSLPFTPGHGQILQNGRPITETSDVIGARVVLTLRRPGRYIFTRMERAQP